MGGPNACRYGSRLLVPLILLLAGCLGPCAANGCPAGDLACPRNGSVVCWGLAPLEATGAYIRAADEAGAGGSGGNSTQLLLLETDLAFSSLAAENSFVCGLADGGTRVACWGSGLLPELVAAAAGSGQAGQSVAAVLPGDASNAAVKLVTGDSSVCALLEDRSLECLGGCWVKGPRGSGSPFSPVLAGPGGAALECVDVAAGAQHVCCVLINGSVACFGSNAANQLGPPGAALPNSSTPVLVGDASLAFTGVAAGDAFSCGLLANGTAACWGGYSDNSQEQLLPAGLRLVVGYAFDELAAKGATLCGVTSDSADLVCEGVISSFIGADGYPGQVYSEEPVVIESLRSFASLSVGGSGFYFHACGLEAGGQALCWGLDNEGQLGVDTGSKDGSMAAVAPAAVDTPLRFSSIAAGGAFTCAVVA
ncbi:hypothetical protein ABPG77_006150 [Micractinium sp. CCAP 211/92]